MTFRYTRNGALRFLRIGLVQLSFCLCKRQPAKPQPDTFFADGMVAIMYGAAVLAAFL